jgi:hypothetical protein
MDGNEEVRRDLEAISLALQEAKNYGLEVEVIYSALKEMKMNGAITIEMAINSGLNEWVK